jgi:hypothetical protein
MKRPSQDCILHILPMRTDVQMRRIYASCIVTFVQNVEMLWDINT